MSFCLQRGGSASRGVCLRRVLPTGEICLQGYLPTEGSAYWGSASGGRGVGQIPVESERRAVHLLLQCFLLSDDIYRGKFSFCSVIVTRLQTNSRVQMSFLPVFILIWSFNIFIRTICFSFLFYNKAI